MTVMFFFLFVISLWFIALLFEANGGRAAKISSSSSLGDGMRVVGGWIGRINIITSAIVLLFLLTGLILWVYKKNRDAIDKMFIRSFLRYSFCGLIVSAFLIVLSTRTGSGYLSRVDVIISVFFYIFMAVFCAFGYVIKRIDMTIVILPILLFILICATITGTRIYAETNNSNLFHEKCIEIDRDLIDQIVSADKAGLKEMTLYVPESTLVDNWPHTYYLGERISLTAYRHGIISNLISITTQPDSAKNELFHLD